MFNRLLEKIISLFQLVLVLIFIIFEELIWEGIALPVYEWLHGLKVLEKVEYGLRKLPASMILVLFIVMLISVEMLGIYAGVMFVSGHLLTGLVMYAGKIPIAAFTFWMFRVTEEKLMQFGWFQWLYEKIMGIIDWLKSLEIYQHTMKRLKQLKIRLKILFTEFKIRYFQKESLFWQQLKRVYHTIKKVLKRG